MENLKNLLPILTTMMHKGSCGRIGVIGGSLEYTGAPYFAAITSLKLGADLAHVFCHEDAANAIKSYSPSLIVHPGWNPNEEFFANLKRIDSIVIGPGLGRSKEAGKLSEAVFRYVAESNKPAVYDGDAIYWVCQMAEKFPRSHSVVFTPNKVEFGRLQDAFLKSSFSKNQRPSIEDVKELSIKIGASILLKGEKDYYRTIDDDSGELDEKGGLRRCGGQGDILAGALGTTLNWARMANSSIAEACIASSFLVRRVSNQAFTKIGRSVEAQDMIAEIPATIQRIEGFVHQ